jgi:hypothetical protein
VEQARYCPAFAPIAGPHEDSLGSPPRGCFVDGQWAFAIWGSR